MTFLIDSKIAKNSTFYALQEVLARIIQSNYLNWVQTSLTTEFKRLNSLKILYLTKFLMLLSLAKFQYFLDLTNFLIVLSSPPKSTLLYLLTTIIKVKLSHNLAVKLILRLQVSGVVILPTLLALVRFNSFNILNLFILYPCLFYYYEFFKTRLLRIIDFRVIYFKVINPEFLLINKMFQI